MPPGVLDFRIAKFSSLPGLFYAVPCHVRGSQHGMQLQASCIIVPRVLNFMRRARAHYPQLEVSVQIPRSLTLMACRRSLSAARWEFASSCSLFPSVWCI